MKRSLVSDAIAAWTAATGNRRAQPADRDEIQERRRGKTARRRIDGGKRNSSRNRPGNKRRNDHPESQTQPNDMRRSTTDGRNDQLRHWLADGNLDVAVADFTGMRPAWSWWISIRNVWCWSLRTRCDWISPAAGPPSAPVTCHPWSAARSYWAIRRTSTDASATCCSAEPDSLPWLRAGNLIRDQLRHIRLRLPVERGR